MGKARHCYERRRWCGGPTEKEARGGCETRQDGVGGAGARCVDVGRSAARGQQEQPEEAASPTRVREALRQAIELHKSREYEKAAPFFVFAKTGEKALTPPELKDLAAFSAQNAIALKGRQDGAALLQKADLAIREGRTKEVGPMLGALNANQFLTPAERRQVSDLTRKLLSDTDAKKAPTPTKDAKTLLAEGRDALKAGDLARAELLADQAEKAERATSWLPSWNNEPAKLRRDIQAAKAKLATPEVKKEPDSKSSSWWPFAKNETQPTQTDPQQTVKIPDPAPKNPDPPATSKFGGFWPFGGNSTPPKKDPPKEMASPGRAERQMLNDAFIFLEANDIERARVGANLLKDLNLKWEPNERNPDMLLAEIQRRTGGPMPAVPTAPRNVATDPAPKKAAPEIAKKKPIELDPKADPRVLLKQGRAALQDRRLDEADKACSFALAAKASWGFWEDTPEKLRRDLTRAHQTADRDESVRLMVEARKACAAGNLDDAEKKAYRAQQLHGPYGVFDFGERPTGLLEEVRQAKLAKAKENPKSAPIAKKDAPTLPDAAPGIPAGVQSANKNRAIVMVREARELERQGMLVQARQKAMEARDLKAPFLPDEDSPDNLLLGLSARAGREIQAHMQQSIAVAGVVNDPQRFRKAAAELSAARDLAVVFGLDLTRIDVAFSQLAQVEMGNRSLSTVAAPPNNGDPFRIDPIAADAPTGDAQKDALRKQAREKLMYAQRELSAGKYETAARMAEELCNPAYGVREEAMRLLRSINAEEFNQRILEAKRTFESGLDCVAHKDFRKAMYLFQSIDTMYLPVEYQRRMGDIMVMREMQPQAPEQQYQKPAFLRASAIEDKAPATARAANSDPEDLLGHQKAMEKVQYEALRMRGYETLKTAHEKFKAGQKQDAVQTLEAYVQQVNDAGLSDNGRSNELRRPAETRIQQYKTLIAESAIARAGSGKTIYSYHNEGKRQAEIQKRQEEVAALVKEGAELYKQGKLKESEAIGRKVLAIDPDNTAALMLVMTSQTKRNQQIYDKDVHDDDATHLILLGGGLMPRGQQVTSDNPVTFDPEIQKRHNGIGGDGGIRHNLKDDKERAIEYRLKQPISLNFNNTPLRDAISSIAIQSGIQVVPDLRALQEAKVNLDAPLSGSADNINMKNALNILLKPMRLSYVIEDQVLKITTENYTIGRLVRITYPIADLIVPVEDHPLPDQLDMIKVLARADRLVEIGYTYGVGMSGFGMNPGMPVSSHGQGLGGAFGSQSGQPGGGAPRPRTKDTIAQELKDLIQNTVSKNTWEDMGGTGGIQYFPMGLALVITQTQEVQEEVQLLLETLRKLQDLQVSVELRAVLVSETFFERIGVDFNMNILPPISRTQPNLLNNTFVPAPFLNQTGRGLNMVSGLTSAGTLTPDLGIPINNHSFAFTQPQFGGYQPTAGLQLGLAFLSDIQVFMFLEAVQGDRRAHIMQAPKLTVYNGQTATITGNMTRPEVLGMTPNQMGNGALFMSPVMATIPFGLTMTVQPVVSPDRRFIRLNVQPQLVGGGVTDPAAATVNVLPQALNTTLDGGIQIPPLANNQIATIIQPQTQNVFIAQTTVNVPDGGTVLLGGFKFMAEERTEYGPPILSNIPYLSRLFRNVGWSRDGSTLIYLVTARVIMIEEEENLFLGNIPPIPGR